MRLAAAVTALTLPLLPLPAQATTGDCWETGRRCQDINAYRATGDLPGVDEFGQERLPVPGWTPRPPLDQSAALQADARDYARTLAATGDLRHATDVSGGEAIGRTLDWATVVVAWAESSCMDGTWPEGCPGHRELLLDRDFTRIGIGSAVSATGIRYYVLRLR